MKKSTILFSLLVAVLTFTANADKLGKAQCTTDEYDPAPRVNKKVKSEFKAVLAKIKTSWKEIQHISKTSDFAKFGFSAGYPRANKWKMNLEILTTEQDNLNLFKTDTNLKMCDFVFAETIQPQYNWAMSVLQNKNSEKYKKQINTAFKTLSQVKF